MDPILKDAPPRESKPPGEKVEPAGLEEILARSDGRLKYIAERFKKDFLRFDPNRRHFASQAWIENFEQVIANCHGNAYASGFRMTSGKEPDPLFVESIARASRDLESYYSQGFLNDILSGDSRYVDENGVPKPEAIHQRMQMYLGRASGTANGGWVDGCDPEEEITWKLGVTESGHCEDCQTFADDSPYTRDTLASVPRGNDTPCLFRCDCHLERKSDGMKTPPPPTFSSFDDITAIEPPPMPDSGEEPVLLVPPGGGAPEYVIHIPPRVAT